MSKVHEKWIADFINNNKETSFIGSELKSALLKEFPELNDAYARKIISDCFKKHLINSTAPVTFGNNEYVYYSFMADRKFELLKENIKKYKPKMHRAIFALRRNNGILSYSDLCRITGAYTNNNLHDVDVDSIIRDLKDLNIATMHEYRGINFLTFTTTLLTETDVENLENYLKDKNILLYQCLLWLSRNNIISPNRLLFSGEGNCYKGIANNDVIWDAFGYTNTVGLGGGTKDFQTIAVVDFLCGYKYEEYDFSGFSNRVEHLVFSVKKEKRKVLPIIIANEFSPAAKALISKEGYMCFELDTILGKNAQCISRSYRETVDKIKKSIGEGNTEDIADGIEGFCHSLQNDAFEKNYQNLKGDLFEYLMFPVFAKIFDKQGTRIIHNFSRSVNGERFECDYRIETENENIFVELKGYRSDYKIPFGKYDEKSGRISTNQCVKWFLSETYEKAKAVVGNERKSSLCYITTASLEDKAKKVLLQRKKDKPLTLESFYERDGLLELLKQYDFKREAGLIEQYFN